MSDRKQIDKCIYSANYDMAAKESDRTSIKVLCPLDCVKCGKRAYTDIDGDEWTHRCADGVLRWADGNPVYIPLLGEGAI